MRTTVKITTAIAALLIVTPARACTDWKEVAALDAIIAADDRENSRNAEALTSKCGSSTPKECDAKMDYEAQQIMSAHMADVSNDRESALKDQCK
jgi:hypothetical protein